MTDVLSQTLRLGIIGCGNIAYWTHFREIRKVGGAELIAASDPSAEARRRAANLAKIPVYETSAELLARTDIDAVIVCAPTDLHARLAIQVAKAGKHFYLEKPIAINAEESKQVLRVAAQCGVTAATGFNRRFHPAFRKARSLIQSGKIGKIRAVQTAFCEPISPDGLPIWKRQRSSGGGVLLDLASHHIDQIRWTLGQEISSVQAAVESIYSQQDTASLQFTMAGGACVSSYFSFRAGRKDTLDFIGEYGIIRVDRFRCFPFVSVSRKFGYGVKSSHVMPDWNALSWWLLRLKSPSWESSYRGALQAFILTCRGLKTDLATLEDGRKSLEVVLAAEAYAAKS